ncbi:MAG: sensor histidine kinase [Rhodoglobus sp.]
MIATAASVRVWLARAFDRPTPIVKQFATVAGVVAALVILMSFDDINITEPTIMWTGVALVVVATIIAVIFTVNPQFSRYAHLIPAIGILALGAIRAGTGGTGSIFASLIILPVIWMASGDGRRYILYAGVGTSVALMLPYMLGLSVPLTSGDWLRGIYTPAVFATAGAIVNELARQGRAQLASIRSLADEKAKALTQALDYASELEESQHRVRAVHRMFRGVWDAVTEQSVIGTSPIGLIDAWNPGAEKLLKMTRTETEGKKFIYDFHIEEELEHRSRELNYPPGETVLVPGFSALVESARLGQAEVRDWTYVRSDGTTLPVRLSVTKRVDENGETLGYLFVATDVTKELEVSRLKDEFVGLISHELRTPLSSILGYLELMRDDTDEPLSPEQLQYLGVAERNAHRLLKLVGDLLFTAQVESGKFSLDLRDVSLCELISASIESSGPAAAAAGIELQPLGKAQAIVTGDVMRLGQALDNLLSNAIKFTPRGGTITVSVDVVGHTGVVSVRDTGMGIPESELDQLFARFFRATTATRNAVPGVGLGLTITKAIVDAHRGTMAVTSVEGEGTEFTLTLPLVGTKL